MTRFKINYFGKPSDSTDESLMSNYHGRYSSLFELVSDYSGKFDIFTCDTIDPGHIYQPKYIPYRYPRALWIQEVRPLRKKLFEYIEQNFDVFMECFKFDYIFTLDKELSSLKPNILYLEGNGSFIKYPGIYTKTKLCSMITSNKTITEAQKVRVEYASKFKECLDLYGNGFNPIECKSQGLNKYMFSVAIENTFSEATFTEKLLDCFLTGTVPIYLGASDLGSIFDTQGIIQLDSNFNIEELTPELYKSLYPHILKNYIISLEMLFPLERVLHKVVDLPAHYHKRNKLNDLLL